MGYHMIKVEELYEVYRLLCSGKSKSEISRIRKLDRKTIREYGRLFARIELNDENRELDFLEFASKMVKVCQSERNEKVSKKTLTRLRTR